MCIFCPTAVHRERMSSFRDQCCMNNANHHMFFFFKQSINRNAEHGLLCINRNSGSADAVLVLTPIIHWHHCCIRLSLWRTKVHELNFLLPHWYSQSLTVFIRLHAFASAVCTSENLKSGDCEDYRAEQKRGRININICSPQGFFSALVQISNGKFPLAFCQRKQQKHLKPQNLVE